MTVQQDKQTPLQRQTLLDALDDVLRISAHDEVLLTIMLYCGFCGLCGIAARFLWSLRARGSLSVVSAGSRLALFLSVSLPLSLPLSDSEQ